MSFDHLSDRDLLRDITRLVGSHREITAKLVAHLGEIEDRRLHLIAGYRSMFEFCVKHLRMSEGEAFRRILASRLGRQFPAIHELIASGAVHLSALELLSRVLTDENHAELLEAASGKSKREVEELLATRFPKPDAPDRVRKLPDRPVDAGPTLDLQPTPPRLDSKPARVQPLSEARFKIEFTASAELREKLERARDLMSHANPTRDMATVFERALDVLIEDLEKKKLRKTKQPRKRRGSTKPGHISSEVRRQVFERDGSQCTYVSPDGRRCEAQSFLELDHIVPPELGGSDEPDNLRVRCGSHNRLWAEQLYGREHVERCKHFRQQKQNASSEVFEKVRVALKVLGFRRGQARRAVSEVEASFREIGEPPSMEQVLREAIRVANA